jgi:hypothetical protein
LQIGGFLFDLFDYGVFDIPLPSTIILVAQIGNLIAIFTLLAIIVRMPVAIPSNKVDLDELAVSGSFAPLLFHDDLFILFRDAQYQWKSTPHFGVG